MKINAVNIDGKLKDYDVILTYYSDEYDKNYVVYTDKQYNENNELIIYISSYNLDNFETIVDNIEDREEYSKIEKQVNEILSNLKIESERFN